MFEIFGHVYCFKSYHFFLMLIPLGPTLLAIWFFLVSLPGVMPNGTGDC